MKKNIGIWIDTKQAILINLSKQQPTIKKIASNIVTRERVPGETKKFGRFGGQYLTFEKNRLMKHNFQTSQFLKILIKEISSCESVVLFGPSKMKKKFEKEIRKNMQLNHKLAGVFNAEPLTENQMVAWVKKFYNHPS